MSLSNASEIYIKFPYYAAPTFLSLLPQSVLQNYKNRAYSLNLSYSQQCVQLDFRDGDQN